jgi:hypothetical protein
MECFHVFFPIISFGLNIIYQIVLSRYLKTGVLKSIIGGFILGTVILLTLELYYFFKTHGLFINRLSLSFTNFIIYAALGYGYFHFINLGETARRIRILRELFESKGGLSMQELLERYNAKEIIEKRLERLLKNGQIILRDNRYYIGKPFMLWASKMIIFLKSLILGRKSEFDIY